MTHPISKSDDKDVGIAGIVLFLILTFAWSWGFWGSKVLLELGVVEGVPVLPNLGAFGPTVAAFLLVAYANGFAGVRQLAGRAIQLDYPKQWILVALLLPPAIVGGALAVAVVTGTTPTFPWAGQPIVLLLAFVWIFLLGGPIQEEFGWRGYLLDPLQERLTPLGGGLAVGLVWAVWHLPLFYIPSETIYYDNPFLGFAVSITLLSVLMTWVYNSTNGSLLPALLMHTSWNWAQGMFPILDSDPASLAMVGLLVAATIVVVVYSGSKRLGQTGRVAQSD
ncbi:CPBP family intramembrane metalloprotease [Haloarcula sp. Atlit-47R]|uniref:CPBP family intramembrane glutamic endopeptidase n=1 Tax=Haloarcula sp. Atlit-47R TaxID=2282132 RepID=UPI000EF24C1D|nr:type II CAAX endopeptidase family protein [Haloarcula sp. Atlit-47R]RLM42063.1 CPBP family intramembrane metalloprotease [Haloarcula sp. Atlit-47R]